MKIKTIPCPFCGKTHILEITEEQFEKYKSGEGHIQNIFSNFKPEIREMLISGTCPECWNKYMKIED